MSDYEAKGYYQDQKVAQAYNSQYESPLQSSNLRARFVNYWEVRAFSRLLSHAPPNGNMLDVACGTGRFTQQLLNRGYQVGGTDISAEMMTLARRRVGSHSNSTFWLQVDAEHLPFADQAFDGVTCIRLFHRIHPAARLQMLREIKRVTKNWAILFFGMSSTLLSLRSSIRSKLIPGRPSNPFPISEAQLQEELKSIGFKIREHRWVMPYVTEGMMVFVDRDAP